MCHFCSSSPSIFSAVSVQLRGTGGRHSEAHTPSRKQEGLGRKLCQTKAEAHFEQQRPKQEGGDGEATVPADIPTR